MPLRHPLHLPRRHRKLIHGINSRGVRILPHTVQWLLPPATLSPLGIRSIITFKKLNTQAPKKKRMSQSTASTIVNIIIRLRYRPLYFHDIRYTYRDRLCTIRYTLLPDRQTAGLHNRSCPSAGSRNHRALCSAR